MPIPMIRRSFVCCWRSRHQIISGPGCCAGDENVVASVMTLWEALWPRALKEAQEQRFGTLTVRVELQVRDGVIVKVVHAKYDQDFSLTLEDLKVLDRRQELA